MNDNDSLKKDKMKMKDSTEYALAGMDYHLFVSTYMLTLHDTKQLEAFLIKETKELAL